jgi:outer membrane assembly lipoprotein YfiO
MHLSRCRSRSGILLAFALVLGGCATGGGRPIAPSSGPDQLRVAKLRYDQHQYTDAVDLLKGYIQFQSGASDLDEAHFVLGMCYVKRSEWPLAATEFQILTTDFADSPRLGDAHYWLGFSYWKQTRPAPYDQDMTRRAIGQFDRFLTLFPDHPQVAEIQKYKALARDRLAEKAYNNGALYLKLHHFSPARYYFALVRKDYPEGRWAELSLPGQAEAYYREGYLEEARMLLATTAGSLTDPEARRRAGELIRKYGPPKATATPVPAVAPDSAAAPPDSAGASG